MNSTTMPSDFISQDSHRSIGIIIIEVALSILIDTVALFGNVLVSLAVIRSPKLRTSTSMFILALAVADVLTALICIPITCGILVSDDWINTSTLCHIQGFAILTLAFMSMATLALTALNRFFRVVKPAIYKRFFTKRNSLLLIGIAWFMIIAFYAGLLLSKTTHVRYEPSYAVCAVAHILAQTLVEFVCVILAFITIVVSYSLVFVRIRRHQLSMIFSSILGQGRDLNISVEEIKISNVLFMSVLGFAICWIPSLVIITMDRVAPDTTPPRSRTLLCTYLNYLSAALNPFIYGVMNRSFRAEYKRILLCRKTQIDVPQAGSKAIRTFRNTARAAVIWKTRIASNDKVEMSKVASHKKDISNTLPLENGDAFIGNTRSSSPCSGVVTFSHISRTSSPTVD